MIVNNSGGVEFKYKSNSNAMPIIDKYIAAAGHYKNAKGWAEDCGFIYMSAKTENEFDDAIDTHFSVFHILHASMPNAIDQFFHFKVINLHIARMVFLGNSSHNLRATYF